MKTATRADGTTLRIARYSAYPRAASDHALQTGLTRSADETGLRIVTAAPEPVGSLLRVEISDLADRDALDTLARVVSCSRSATGRFELTLEALDAHRPRFARRGAARAARAQSG